MALCVPPILCVCFESTKSMNGRFLNIDCIVLAALSPFSIVLWLNSYAASTTVHQSANIEALKFVDAICESFNPYHTTHNTTPFVCCRSLVFYSFEIQFSRTYTPICLDLFLVGLFAAVWCALAVQFCKLLLKVSNASRTQRNNSKIPSKIKHIFISNHASALLSNIFISRRVSKGLKAQSWFSFHSNRGLYRFSLIGRFFLFKRGFLVVLHLFSLFVNEWLLTLWKIRKYFFLHFLLVLYLVRNSIYFWV